MLIYCDLLIFSIVSQSTNRDSTIWHESSLNRIDFSLHELMQREVSWYSLENSCMNKCPIRIGFFLHEQLPRVYLCNPFENICNSIKKEADNTWDFHLFTYFNFLINQIEYHLHYKEYEISNIYLHHTMFFHDEWNEWTF